MKTVCYHTNIFLVISAWHDHLNVGNVVAVFLNLTAKTEKEVANLARYEFSNRGANLLEEDFMIDDGVVLPTRSDEIRYGHWR